MRAADTGAADPRLAAALAAWAGGPSPAATAQVYAALVAARVFAAICASRSGDSERAGRHRSGPTELALLTLVGSAGGRAVPLFLDAAAAGAFRPHTRPLPLRGPQACTAALQDGAVAVLLDPPGAAFAASGAPLVDLAAGRAPIAGSPLSFWRSAGLLHAPAEGDQPDTDPALAVALAAALRSEPVRAARLLQSAHGPVLGLVPDSPLDAAGLAGLAARVLPRLAAVLPADGLDVTVVPADGPGRPVPLERGASPQRAAAGRSSRRGLGRPGRPRRGSA